MVIDTKALDRVVDESIARAAIQNRDYARMTLGEFAEHVWRPVRLQTNDPQTWKKEWVGGWRPHIIPAMGHLKLSALDAHKWQQFLAAHEGQWNGRMKAWIQNAYRCCIRYAGKLGAVAPKLAETGFEKIRGASKRTREPGEALTAEEVGKLLNASGKPVHRALLAYVFGLGIRPSEASKLEWPHIRWDKGVLKVVGTKNKQAEAVVGITSGTLLELKAWWEACGRPASGPVFVWRGKPIRDWRGALENAVARSGIDPDGTRKIMPYSGRYTYATIGIVAGVNEAAMRRGMRHAYASRVMETVYQRLSEEQLVEQMAAFPGFTCPK